MNRAGRAAARARPAGAAPASIHGRPGCGRLPVRDLHRMAGWLLAVAAAHAALLSLGRPQPSPPLARAPADVWRLELRLPLEEPGRTPGSRPGTPQQRVAQPVNDAPAARTAERRTGKGRAAWPVGVDPAPAQGPWPPQPSAAPEPPAARHAEPEAAPLRRPPGLAQADRDRSAQQQAEPAHPAPEADAARPRPSSSPSPSSAGALDEAREAGVPDAFAPPDALQPDGWPAAAEPLPLYRPRLPAPAVWAFEMRRGAQRGAAVIDWQPDAASGRYALSLQASADGRAGRFTQRSAGSIGLHGLEPERFVDARSGRGQRAVNFRRSEGELSFSASTDRLPLVPGVQDRLAWLVQLVGVVAERTARGEPPAREPIVLGVAGLRGGQSRWVFSLAPAADDGDPAARGTVHVQRRPESLYDTQIDVWLDERAPHAPRRLRYTEARGAPLELQRTMPP